MRTCGCVEVRHRRVLPDQERQPPAVPLVERGILATWARHSCGRTDFTCEQDASAMGHTMRAGCFYNGTHALRNTSGVCCLANQHCLNYPGYRCKLS